MSLLQSLLPIILSVSAVLSQSIYRLPDTILPTHYDLTLHPDIINATFYGEERISLNITAAYFDDLTGNFDLTFNYYPNNNMVISSADFQVTTDDDTSTFALISLSLNATTQIAIATFNVTKIEIQEIGTNDPAASYVVAMNFSADLRGDDGYDIAGWYLSEYIYEGVTVTNVVTQFQATDARSVFPCLDEPAFKSTFNVTLIAPANATKLFNTPPLGDEVPVEGDCTWTSPEGVTDTQCHSVRFATTPLMSTYLLAFVVGGYLSVGDESQSVYYPYSFTDQSQRAQFALDQTGEVVDVLESADAFNRNLTNSGITKLDSIGVSDFTISGMANWGLLIYPATQFLVDESVSSQSAKSGQIVSIAHQVANQWFGNLVSPSFWDDVWLNEAFSSWSSYFASNLVQPGYNAMEHKLSAITDVMFDDASVFTPRVRPSNLSGDPSLILSSLTSIPSQKGMAVANTVANYMSQSVFLEAMTTYLDRYAFGSATSDDLAEVLSEFEERANEVMLSFIDQEGFPLVTIETEENGGNLTFTISQQRFVSMGPTFWNNPGSIPFVTDDLVTAFGDQLWSIPMLWKDGEGTMVPVGAENNIMSDAQLVSTKARPDSSVSEYYLVNPVDGVSESEQGLSNYFRVFYDEMSLNMLLDHWTEIGAQDQMLIISDRFALAMSGYISSESYLGFAEEVSDQMLSSLNGQQVPDYAVYRVLIESLLRIDDILCELALDPDESQMDLALRANLREFTIDFLRNVLSFVVSDITAPFASITNDEQCPDGSDCNELQSLLLKALVTLNDVEVVTAAYNLYFAAENRECIGCDLPLISADGRIDFVSEDVLEALIGGVLAFDTTNNRVLDEIERVYALVNAEQQSAILNALGALYVDSSGVLVRDAIQFILSDAVRPSLRVHALGAFKTCTARETLWEYLTESDEGGSTPFDELFTATSGVLYQQALLTSLADTFAATSKYDDISSFFDAANRTNEGTEQVLSRTLETVYWRSLWRVDSTDGMTTFLRAYVVDKYTVDWSIEEIVFVTAGCCAGLILLVFVYWTMSKPTASDRVQQYFSRKHEKRQRRKSSMGAGQPALTSSLGHSLDQSLREHTYSQQNNTKYYDRTSAAAETTEPAESSAHSNGHRNNEPDLETSMENGNEKGSGYGAGKGFNYTALKDEQHQ